MIVSYVPFTPNTFMADGEGQTFGHSDPATSWPTQLGGIGRMQNWNILNIAENGDTGTAITNRYNAIAYKGWPTVTQVPAIFWLHAGPTDIENGVSGVDCYNSVKGILVDAATRGFRGIGVTQCWYSPTQPQYNTQFDSYNTLIAADPNVTPGLVFPGHLTFPNSGQPPYFNDPDSGHLNPAGNLVYATAVYNLMLSLGLI